MWKSPHNQTTMSSETIAHAATTSVWAVAAHKLHAKHPSQEQSHQLIHMLNSRTGPAASRRSSMLPVIACCTRRSAGTNAFVRPCTPSYSTSTWQHDTQLGMLQTLAWLYTAAPLVFRMMWSNLDCLSQLCTHLAATVAVQPTPEWCA
jgi:hypothetical protein